MVIPDTAAGQTKGGIEVLADSKCDDAQNRKDTGQSIDREVEYLISELDGSGHHSAIAMARFRVVRDKDALVESADGKYEANVGEVCEYGAEKIKFDLDR